MDQQQRAVDCGIWPLYRYDPRLVAEGKPPLTLDSKPPKLPVTEYMGNETRFRMIEKMDRERYKMLGLEAQRMAGQRIALYQHMAQLTLPGNGQASESAPAAN
jgi:pyruvate-ferredoxin/flavodoxin oxidoreductase